MKYVLPLCLMNSEGACPGFPLLLPLVDFLFSTLANLSDDSPRLVGEVDGTDV